jgi:DNA-binding NtrC family response regulator
MTTQKEEQDYIWNALDDIFPSRLVVDLNEQIADLERSSIVNALDACEQNQTKAAKMLSVGRTALIAKMKKYDLLLK